MYAFISLPEWILWIKSHNNEFASFLREVGTPCIVGTTFSRNGIECGSCAGFFIPILPGWCIKYNSNLQNPLSDGSGNIELFICELKSDSVG